MSLVAYEDSDLSEYEDDERDETEKSELNENTQNSGTRTENNTSANGIFNHLPEPSTKKFEAETEEDDEFLHKKEDVSQLQKPKAKITVPSLNDFKDVKSSIPNAKPRKSSGKCGLLNILPEPKNAVTTSSKFLIPQVVSSKASNGVIAEKKQLKPTSIIKSKPPTQKSILQEYSDDSDNEDEVQNDFFSIHKPVEIPVDVPSDMDPIPGSSHTKVTENISRSIDHFFKKPESSEPVTQTDFDNLTTGINNSEDLTQNDSSRNDVELDEEAIMKLVGARGKRKREDIQIVDVNQQEVLADAREWLLKGLMDDTSKRVSSSKRRGNEPTNQQKRKHQITYLAHQAKANEAELQNQWANNRMTKRKTQSKYGF